MALQPAPGTEPEHEGAEDGERDDHPLGDSSIPTSGSRRPRQAASATLALAGILIAAGVLLHRDRPSIDSFYTVSAALPSTPGALIRSETFTREIPSDAKAVRILYTSTGLDGRTEPASGLVVAPKDARGPVPVVLWTHGTNVPDAPTAIPTLLGQGLDDQLVLPDVQRAFVEELCGTGQAVDFRTYRDRDHVALVAGDSPLIPQLLRWTRDRFRGAPAPRRCTIARE